MYQSICALSWTPHKQRSNVLDVHGMLVQIRPDNAWVKGIEGDMVIPHFSTFLAHVNRRHNLSGLGVTIGTLGTIEGSEKARKRLLC